MGRKARPKLLAQAAPLIRVRPKDLIDAGVEQVGRVVGLEDGIPLLECGRTLDVKNVIWCTGYKPGFSWIDLPVFREDGRPIHERGVSKKVPGLYFVGLHFQYAMSSATLVGIGRDAEFVVDALEARSRLVKSRRGQVRSMQVSSLEAQSA
jgi:putative flavoprotein involved in K+ transport